MPRLDGVVDLVVYFAPRFLKDGADLDFDGLHPFRGRGADDVVEGAVVLVVLFNTEACSFIGFEPVGMVPFSHVGGRLFYPFPRSCDELVDVVPVDFVEVEGADADKVGDFFRVVREPDVSVLVFGSLSQDFPNEVSGVLDALADAMHLGEKLELVGDKRRRGAELFGVPYVVLVNAGQLFPGNAGDFDLLVRDAACLDEGGSLDLGFKGGLIGLLPFGYAFTVSGCRLWGGVIRGYSRFSYYRCVCLYGVGLFLLGHSVRLKLVTGAGSTGGPSYESRYGASIVVFTVATVGCLVTSNTRSRRSLRV